MSDVVAHLGDDEIAPLDKAVHPPAEVQRPAYPVFEGAVATPQSERLRASRQGTSRSGKRARRPPDCWGRRAWPGENRNPYRAASRFSTPLPR